MRQRAVPVAYDGLLQGSEGYGSVTASDKVASLITYPATAWAYSPLGTMLISQSLLLLAGQFWNMEVSQHGLSPQSSDSHAHRKVHIKMSQTNG